MERLLLDERLDQLLNEVSTKIIPDDNYITDGNEAVNEIFRLLSQKSRYALDRCYIAGSMGKKSSIVYSDFDCVMFVNGISSLDLLEKVLDDFEDILLVSEKPTLQDIKKTKHSLQFKFKGFNVDLLPGINVLPENMMREKPGMDVMASEQAFEILRRVQADPRKRYAYSSSLCETNLKFMRRQSEFVHRLVRIAKFWNQSLYIADHVSGRSTTLELIAVHVGQKEERNRSPENPSLLNAFKLFLETIRNFRSIRVKFSDFNPLANLPDGRRNQTFVGNDTGLPMIIEPSNPFNNLAKNFDDQVVELFQDFSKETLYRLQNFQKFLTPTGCNFTEIIFEKFPKVLPLPQELRFRYLTSGAASFIMSEKAVQTERMPSLKVNKNSQKYDGYEMQMVLNGMKPYLETSVVTANSTASAKKAARKAINVSIQGGAERDWGATSESLENYDVILTIPVPPNVDDSSLKAVIIGYTAPSV